MSEEHSHDVAKWVKKYRAVGITLFVLTVVTVSASYMSFGVALGIGVALAIACVKGSLVAAFFMHLVDEKPIIIWLLLLTVFFFFFLLLMPSLWWMNDLGL